MKNHQSSAMDKAMQLIREGSNPFAAARETGLSPASVYRALNRPANEPARKALTKHRAMQSK